MIKNPVRKALLILPACLLAYLASVAMWSWVSVDEVLANEVRPGRYTELSASQAAILLKIEDPTFFEHAGIDLSDGQGLTTVTSSVARDVFLYEAKLDGVKGLFQSMYRAVFECCKKADIGRDLMALVLDAHLSKEEQFSRYVSGAYMGSHRGEQIIGFSEASQAYLGKPIAQASDKEFTRLVAMVKSPNQFHPARHASALAERVARIEEVVAGRCHPSGWFDTTYAHCKARSSVTPP
jgi:membrane carboxypeptidase/penicillin-binding protein